MLRWYSRFRGLNIKWHGGTVKIVGRMWACFLRIGEIRVQRNRDITLLCVHLCVYVYERGVDTLKLNIARSAFKLCCSSINCFVSLEIGRRGCISTKEVEDFWLFWSFPLIWKNNFSSIFLPYMEWNLTSLERKFVRFFFNGLLSEFIPVRINPSLRSSLR